MQAMGPRRARVVAPLLMAGALVAFYVVAEPGGGPLMTLFYMLVPLAFGVLFSLAWLLGADVLEEAPREQIARSYGILGASSILGGIAGGALARLAASRIDPEGLLLAGAFGLGAAAVTAAVTQHRFPWRPVAPTNVARAPDLADLRGVVGQRYSFLLLAVAMSASLVGILVDQFYLAAATSGNDGRANAGFFANFYLVLNGLAFVSQLWLVPQIQRRIGVHGSLYILPLALVTGASALITNASILMRSLVRVAEGGLKSSIHRSNWEQAYLPLGPAQRAAAKLVVDGMGARIAEGFAAALVFVWIRSAMADPEVVARGSGWLSWVLLASGLVWVTLTAFLRRSLKPVETRATVEGEARLEIPLPDS